MPTFVRPRAARHVAARLAVLAAAWSLGTVVSAQGSDCAKAALDLAARPRPVCTPPSALSPAETVACAEFERLESIDRECRITATRDDRRRLERYPDEAAHRRAEREELAQVVLKLRAPNARLAELLVARRALDAEAEFYRGKPLKRELQRDLDANDAALLAQRDVFRNIEAEIGGVVDKYADERAHLRKLWAGAKPGTLGVFVPRAPATAR
jgi:hypothetical protein